MGYARSRTPLPPLLLCLFLSLPGIASGLHGQADDETIPVSPDEYSEVRPATCPMTLRGGFTGFVFGYPHAGHEWTANWSRIAVLSAVYDLADYQPQAYDGHRYIVSRDGEARWYDPRIRVRCTATYHYAFGQLQRVSIRYRTVQNFGTVMETGACGGTVDPSIAEPLGAETYDPYDPAPGPVVTALSGTECDGGSGGDGDSGDTGGGGASCTLKYVYLETSTNGGDTWSIYWEGWAYVCG